MGHYLKIPGETPFPVVSPPKPRSAGPGGQPLVLLLAVCCACGYGFLKYGTTILRPGDHKASEPPPVTAAPVSTALPAAEVEDLLQHLQNADATAFKASSELQRSEQWLARLSPALDEEHLSAEKRRLDVARAALESARQSVEKTREQVETTKNLLKERSN
jgi:hypothetical protein